AEAFADHDRAVVAHAANDGRASHATGNRADVVPYPTGPVSAPAILPDERLIAGDDVAVGGDIDGVALPARRQRRHAAIRRPNERVKAGWAVGVASADHDAAIG